MTQTDALSYAIGFCNELARNGSDEAADAYVALVDLQISMIRSRSRRKRRREISALLGRKGDE